MDGIIDFRNLSLTEFSAAAIIINILISFALSWVIAWVYQRTHRGISYSQSFVVTLVLMGMLSCIAMMILGNNVIRALGILGVFTLLRFRTIIKDSKDAVFLFFVLTAGMAIGTNNYSLALIGTVVVSAIILILHKYNFGSVVKEGYLLTFITNGDFIQGSHLALLSKYCFDHRVLQVKSQSDGEKEYYISIRLKEDNAYDAMVSELKKIKGVSFVDLITSREAAEY